MKNILKTIIASAFIFLIIPDNVYAQGPPPWAPAHGYRAKTRHIYFPDHNVYFDLHKKVYLTRERGVWISLPKPPRILVGVNLNVAPQIELDITGDRPYTQNHVHVVKYKKHPKVITKHKVKAIKHHHKGHGHGKHGGKHGKH